MAALVLVVGCPTINADDPRERRRLDTPVGNLLDQLAEQNAGQARFNDEWLQTLKDLVDVGTDAVPELIAELDATDNDMMLRCLGFVLRAIGDARAVPALVRAIPRTLKKPGSDMGLRSQDPDLIPFAQKHDLGERNEPEGRYDLGRPVREICGTLRTLTGQRFNEEELYHIFESELPVQNRMRQKLFHRTAEQWAAYWEANWSKHIADADYARAELPALKPGEEPPEALIHFKTSSGGSNWILESVCNPKSKRVFYDFDTGRAAGIPDRWSKFDDLAPYQDEILAWAGREGFDLVGTEYARPADGRRIFVLRSIGMPAWELGEHRWKMTSQDITLAELQREGSPADSLLVHFDADTQSIDPEAIASFLFMTRDGAVGLLFVGVEVQDDGQKPGGVSNGDDELSPIHFYKGRRFAFTILLPLAE